MVGDVLLAVLITAIAVVLGLTVHPVLFFIIAFAIIYLLARHHGGGARRRAYF